MKDLVLLKKTLHSMIYFVADKPTKKNIDPTIPLVGTKSYLTLLQWCAMMDVDVTRIRFFNQVDEPFPIETNMTSLNKAIDMDHIKVIALGKKASAYLNKSNINEYYELPHPSGLNRINNDSRKLKKVLEQCRSYIYRGYS